MEGKQEDIKAALRIEIEQIPQESVIKVFEAPISQRYFEDFPLT